MLTTQVGDTPRTYRCKKLVLVTGGTDHPRRLGIAGEDLPHVSHYFNDPHIYFGKRLLIVGGKNSAVETALRCYNAGANVSISYRKAALPEKSIKYWLMPEIRYLIESGKIAAHFRTVPSRITSSSVTLVSCDERGKHEQGRHEGTQARRHEEEEGRDGETEGRRDKGESGTCDAKDLPFDFVLLLTGYIQDNSLLRLAGIDLRGECQAPAFDERHDGDKCPQHLRRRHRSGGHTGQVHGLYRKLPRARRSHHGGADGNRHAGTASAYFAAGELTPVPRRQGCAVSPLAGFAGRTFWSVRTVGYVPTREAGKRRSGCDDRACASRLESPSVRHSSFLPFLTRRT